MEEEEEGEGGVGRKEGVGGGSQVTLSYQSSREVAGKVQDSRATVDIDTETDVRVSPHLLTSHFLSTSQCHTHFTFSHFSPPPNVTLHLLTSHSPHLPMSHFTFSHHISPHLPMSHFTFSYHISPHLPIFIFPPDVIHISLPTYGCPTSPPPACWCNTYTLANTLHSSHCVFKLCPMLHFRTGKMLKQSESLYQFP